MYEERKRNSTIYNNKQYHLKQYILFPNETVSFSKNKINKILNFVQKSVSFSERIFDNNKKYQLNDVINLFLCGVQLHQTYVLSEIYKPR